MGEGSIERLKAILSVDEDGEKLAKLLNEVLVDDRKRNMLLIRLDEIKKETSVQKSDLKLSKSEQVMRSLILEQRKPMTAQEAADRIPEQHKSLKYASHASGILNSLVGKGLLGKFKTGYNYYFTTPREAVLEQLKRRDETPNQCSPAEIASETGMPLGTVLDVIEELVSPS